MTEPQVTLPQNADDLLRDFPVTEPDFEAQAKAIADRLQAPRVAAALSDDDLFKAPELASEPNEPPLPSQVRASAPKSHFADMARRSLHKPADDSAALAKELLAATAQSRRPSPELVERMRAAAKSAPTSTPLPPSEPRRERNSGVVARASAPKSPAASVEKPASDKRGVVIALGGIALAAAAAVVLFVSGSAETSPTSATLAAEEASKPPVVAAKPTAAAPLAAAPQPQGVVSPDALPAVAAAEAKSLDPARAAKPSSATAAAGPTGSKASAPAAGAVPRIQLAEDEPPPVAAAEPPAKPVDASEPPLRPAEGNTGSVPLQPSSGAVSTALGAVRSGAQACLAGQTDAVTATVTFASDGHVLRVSASGPSGACIQGALSKAHIAPFAKESFSATTTIRPP